QPTAECPAALPMSWINGILNPNNSDYFEGLGTPQRIIFTAITDNPNGDHFLEFRHEAVKGNIHAYDMLISWFQAYETAANIGNGTRNELQTLFSQECDGAISAPAAAFCHADTGGTQTVANVSGLYRSRAEVDPSNNQSSAANETALQNLIAAGN